MSYIARPMFSTKQFNGKSLPDKVLCLTFDDGPGDTVGEGPGPKTLRLGTYLAEEGIRGAFFMVGRFINQYPQLLPALSAMGHIIGNHTFNHTKPLPEQLQEGWDIVSEIHMTDELIKPFNPDQKVYFRAPWGAWNEAVANALNKRSAEDIDHVGPFYWDIDGADWFYWRGRKSPEKCARAYLRKIKEIGKGIVLCHDSTADIPEARFNNQTFEMMRILIPKLKNLGYRFVGLDEIPRTEEE